MAFSKLIIVGGILFLLLSKAYSHACLKTPNGVRRLKNINDIDRYIIVINGNPKTYTPGQTYNVSLQVNPNISAKKFKHFILTLENERDSTTDNLYHSSGRFGLFETGVMAKFDEDCRNTVIENGKMPKTEIQVYWVAPPENSGCIYIKATVVESYDNWFSEDGQLTKKLCEDNTDEDFKPLIVETCCSCQEAKYEVAFEGRWTRNTHPKGYPSDVWSTKFSDIIGISHERGNAFWSEGMLASDGLKDLADTGTTNTLESELKGMGDNIRTIIKARGLAYPNITSSSYAVFRVDHKNHLVSLVSKIIPSPDWIVGVSNFELCQKDCTWAESHTYNLYPIDVGTNDGIEYLSSAKRNRRREITPITPNNPNDPRSPFYSEDGEPMNPIVKLHFTRQKVYGEMCSDGGSEDPSVDSKDPGEESETERNVAEEIQARERTSKNAGDEEGSDGEVEDKRECAEGENCEVEDESNCPGRKWGDWGPCDVRCGSGSRIRIALPSQISYETDDDANEGESNCPMQEREECFVNCTDRTGESLVIDAFPRNCKVSRWTQWSACDLNGESCGQGTSRKSRHILINPENGGKPCPSRLSQEKECSIPCKEHSSNENSDTFKDLSGLPTECIMSKWSEWTPCSSICGTSALQQRSRKIIYKPSGKICPPRLEDKHCNLPIACTDDGRPIIL